MSLKILGAAGAFLLALAPLAVSAQPAQRPGADHGDHRPGTPGRPGNDRPGNDRPGVNRPGGSQNYGNWDNRWGARPPAPPRHWNKNGDWYRHVRACKQRYRSYDPRTDNFALRRGVNRRCTL